MQRLDSVQELLDQSGVFGWLVLGLGAIAVLIAARRFWVISRMRSNTNELLAKIRKALLVNRSIRDAIKVCEQYTGPVASITKAGLLKYGQPREEVEATSENAASYELGRLEQGLVPLLSIAGATPLLGFLGTLLQARQAFIAAASGGEPGVLAQNLAAALLPMAAGVAVMLPLQLSYNYLRNRTNRLVRDMKVATNMLLETFTEMQRSGVSASASSSSAA